METATGWVGDVAPPVVEASLKGGLGGDCDTLPAASLSPTRRCLDEGAVSVKTATSTSAITSCVLLTPSLKGDLARWAIGMIGTGSDGIARTDHCLRLDGDEFAAHGAPFWCVVAAEAFDRKPDYASDASGG